MHGSGVDLVLSCVDNYEARMVVNQVIATTITKYICFIFFFGISINNATEIFYMVNGYLTTQTSVLIGIWCKTYDQGSICL